MYNGWLLDGTRVNTEGYIVLEEHVESIGGKNWDGLIVIHPMPFEAVMRFGRLYQKKELLYLLGTLKFGLGFIEIIVLWQYYLYNIFSCPFHAFDLFMVFFACYITSLASCTLFMFLLKFLNWLVILKWILVRSFSLKN